MAKLVLGSVVTYKNDHYVALNYDGNLVTIIAPHKGQRKLNVKRSNVTVVDVAPFTLVFVRGEDVVEEGLLSRLDEYLVSCRSDTIISRATNRVMRWGKGHGRRNLILTQAGIANSRCQRR